MDTVDTRLLQKSKSSVKTKDGTVVKTLQSHLYLHRYETVNRLIECPTGRDRNLSTASLILEA